MPLSLLGRLERILVFADKVADEIVCKETEILEKIIPRMFEVMQRVAKFSCDYVNHGKRLCSDFSKNLMVCSENGRSVGWSTGGDRRNGQGVNQGD